jgi:hypothetical protein
MAKKISTPEEPKLFEKFWNEYAMKLDRIAAVRAWNNLDKDLRRAAIDGIQHYREICEALGVRRMWPQGYLNHRRWEDEAAEPQEKVSSSKFQVSSNGAQPNLKPETCQPETRDSDLPDMAIW